MKKDKIGMDEENLAKIEAEIQSLKNQLGSLVKTFFTPLAENTIKLTETVNSINRRLADLEQKTNQPSSVLTIEKLLKETAADLKHHQAEEIKKFKTSLLGTFDQASAQSSKPVQTQSAGGGGGSSSTGFNEQKNLIKTLLGPLQTAVNEVGRFSVHRLGNTTEPHFSFIFFDQEKGFNQLESLLKYWNNRSQLSTVGIFVFNYRTNKCWTDIKEKSIGVWGVQAFPVIIYLALNHYQVLKDFVAQKQIYFPKETVVAAAEPDPPPVISPVISSVIPSLSAGETPKETPKEPPPEAVVETPDRGVEAEAVEEEIKQEIKQEIRGIEEVEDVFTPPVTAGNDQMDSLIIPAGQVMEGLES